MIAIGIILLIIGFVTKIAIVWTIGIIVLVLGLIALLLGTTGHVIGGPATLLVREPRGAGLWFAALRRAGIRAAPSLSSQFPVTPAGCASGAGPRHSRCRLDSGPGTPSRWAANRLPKTTRW